MVEQPEKAPEAAAAEAQAASESLLDSVIAVTPDAEPDHAKEMLGALTKQAMEGVVKFDKNMTRTITKAIAAIDDTISKQLAAIMHSPEFQKLEGTWRGFSHLVFQSETGTALKIKVFNAAKKDLAKDLEKAVEFDQSNVFKKLYENEFGMAGGEPYGALIGDYEFTNHPQDIETLGLMSNIAAAAFCPFVTAAAPGMFGYKSYTELPKTRDLAKLFDTAKHAQWRSFRESEDARFVSLVMPRALARLPYGSQTSPVEEFNYEEFELDKKGRARATAHDNYCWMNASYVMGAKLTEAFAATGWCTAIRGVENGGKVEGLPAHVFTSDDGDVDMKCPTEVGITDRREKELSDLGFLPLCHFKNTDYSVFFGAQTAQKPKEYGPRNTNATANAAISARLPYIMATSRIAHYLKVIGRDKIGAFMEVSDCQDFLENWIADYVTTDEKASADVKARYPLAEAKIAVEEIAGKPGSYQAVAHLRPWLQMEELTASLRMVASIPKKSG